MSDLLSGNLLRYDIDEAHKQERSRDPYRSELNIAVTAFVESIDLPEAPIVVEIGAGLGSLAQAYPKDIQPHIIGTDRDFDIVSESSGSYHKNVVADAMKLPFANESIDMVCGMDVLHWIPDLREAFSEVRRVLKVGGTACFYQTSSPGTIFLEADETVGVPLVIEDKLRLFELKRDVFDKSWAEARAIISKTNQDYADFLDIFLNQYPNIFFAVGIDQLVSDYTTAQAIYDVVFRTINKLILHAASGAEGEFVVAPELGPETARRRFLECISRLATSQMLNVNTFHFGGFSESTLKLTAWKMVKQTN